MDRDISDLITPYKLGRPVLAPSGIEGEFDRYAADHMRIFRHNGRFYCMYIGFDGTGYQTMLAASDDLLHWERKGLISPRGSDNQWDRVGRAVSCVLHDIDLYGNRQLIKKDGKYWMYFHAYPQRGYESGAAVNGLAWTTDEELLDWHYMNEPVFEKGGPGQWDEAGLYSVWIVPHNGSYRLYYNGKSKPDWPWEEQVGLAFSDGLTGWTRYENNPVVRVSPDQNAWDCRFSNGQHVLYDSRKHRWVQFICGYDGKHAQNGVALSEDGIIWEKYPEPLLKYGEPGSIDSIHAHKMAVIWHEGALYQFYCAVRPTVTSEEKARFGNEYRCLTVARSTPFTKEEISSM